MKCYLYLLSAVFTAALFVPISAQEKGGVDLHGPYDVVENWLKPVEEGLLTHQVAVFAESPDRVFIALTGVTPKASAPPGLQAFDPKVPGAKVAHQLYVVNRNGQVTEDWSKQWGELFGSMHDVSTNPYDSERHIWVVDRASQQVLKFTHDGKQLVTSLGEKGAAGSDDKHFGRPTDIAWLPDGTFFVSDGYDNKRVVKFDKNSKFLMTWGSEGKGPGQFTNQVHGIAVDARRRVYVVDRGNARIQIFDENGKYLDQWPGMVSPTRIWITQDQFAWVSDGGAQRLLKYDLNGKLLTYFGTAGTFQGGMAAPHDFSVDSEGSLYVSNGFNHRIDKYVPKKNADRSRLVGQRFVDKAAGTR
jgi:DNA-binding beta-propeller fold protein YncE